MAVPAEVPASPCLSRPPVLLTGRTDQRAGQQHWKRLSAGNVCHGESTNLRPLRQGADGQRGARQVASQQLARSPGCATTVAVGSLGRRNCSPASRVSAAGRCGGSCWSMAERLSGARQRVTARFPGFAAVLGGHHDGAEAQQHRAALNARADRPRLSPPPRAPLPAPPRVAAVCCCIRTSVATVSRALRSSHRGIDWSPHVAAAPLPERRFPASAAAHAPRMPPPAARPPAPSQRR
jgi:hypothetical protein